MAKETWEIVIEKVEKLDDKLDSIDKTLVLQELNLKEHMRRTELLEIQHEKLWKEELSPVKSHVDRVRGIAKFLTFIVPVLITALGLIYKYY